MHSISSVYWKKSIPVLLAGILFVGCNDDDPIRSKVNFDRKAMLEFWADEILIPAYDDFEEQATDLESSFQQFEQQPDNARLAQLQSEFKELYLAFQRVKAFEVGPAANISLRASINTYPTDTSKILGNIQSGSYDLNAATNIDARGLPALDFLLFGRASELLTDATFRAYVDSAVTDILAQAAFITAEWSSYRNTFVNASGTDIGSSLGQMVNSVVFDYEKIKNAKVGFPAGKKSLGLTFPYACEAYYSDYSNALILENLRSIRDFIKGTGYDSGVDGSSIEDYLQALDAKTLGRDLDLAIFEQFMKAEQAVNAIPSTLSIAVDQNKNEVDTAYLEIQKNVILLKNDMPSAMGVLITFQDNDGD